MYRLSKLLSRLARLEQAPDADSALVSDAELERAIDAYDADFPPNAASIALEERLAEIIEAEGSGRSIADYTAEELEVAARAVEARSLGFWQENPLDDLPNTNIPYS